MKRIFLLLNDSNVRRGLRIKHLGAMLMAFALFFAQFSLYAQDRKIEGTIVDDTGEALPGATVTVKGTSSGTVTDLDGKYSLNVSSDAETLVISFIGFETQEVEIGSRAVIDLQLSPDIKALDEVVVVGYGTQKRSKVTSAVSRLDGSEIAELPITSADQALQGRVSGVFVSGSGIPGRNPTIRIRGLSSVNGSDPLFVVDGIIIGQNALNEIHPDNIEDISVLKDAASTAIYGSRGANGVVLITTKKGKPGKGKVSLSAYYGWQDIPENTKYDLLNTDEYINFAQNDFGISAPRFDDYDFATKSFRAGTPSEEFIGVETDWQEAVLPGGPIQDYYLSFSGGTDNVSYNIGGGYFDQDGLLVSTYFKRASLNTNIQAKLGDRLNVGQSLILSRSVQNDDINNGPIVRAIQMMPYIPVYDDTKLGGFRGPDFADGADPFQPVLHTSIVEDEETRTKLFASAFAEVEIFDGFSFRFQAGVENSFTRNQNLTPTYDAGEVDFNQNDEARYGVGNQIYLSPILTSTFNYNKSFGDHTINAVVGYERQIQQFESVNGGTNFLPNEDILDPSLSPIESQTSGRGFEKWGIISWFGRVNYDFQDKYLIGASFRRDESSVFAPGNQIGYFPAASVGWRISEETFFSGLSGVFSDLKFRASYGANGNTNLARYTWDPVVFQDIRYNFGDNVIVQGITTNELFNQDLKWETVIKSNVGLDFELLNGQIYGTVEWFNQKTEDLIVRVPLSQSTGISGSPLANVGEIENRGLEINLGFTDQQSAVKWSVDANVSLVKNEVIKLSGDEDAQISGPAFTNLAIPSTRAEAGEPVGFYYGWKVDKIYQTQDEIDADDQQAQNLNGDPTATRQGGEIAPGDIRFQDLNGDGIIDGEDRTNIGHYLPNVYAGLNGSLNFKNIDFSMNFVGGFGFEILHTNRYWAEGMTRLFNMSSEVLDAWTETNRDTDVPRADPDASSNNARLSDRWVEKGDYVRLRFLTLGYTFPDIAGTGTRVRIYGQGQNLLTFTGYSGYDPEVQGSPNPNASNGNNALFYNGVDNSFIPNPRKFILGVQLSF